MNTRGIRNNNPANIRRGCNWRGLADKQTDSAFCQFESMVWGVRALLVTLRTYVVKHKRRTIPQIIERWAPPQDGNDTMRYIKYVEWAAKEVDYRLSLSLQAIDFDSRYQHNR